MNRTRVVEFLIWWAALSLVWLGTLNVGSPVDIGLGVFVAALGALTSTVARAALDASWRPSTRWLRWVARLPAAVLIDTGRVLFGRSAATTREAPVAGPRDGVAVAGALVNATPATVVRDAHDRTLVLHAVGDKPSAFEREFAR